MTIGAGSQLSAPMVINRLPLSYYVLLSALNEKPFLRCTL